MELKFSGLTEENFAEAVGPVKKALSAVSGHAESNIEIHLLPTVSERRALAEERTLEAVFDVESMDAGGDLVAKLNDIPSPDLMSEITKELTNSEVQGVQITEISEPLGNIYASLDVDEY